ncbi:hypothetical protein DBR32_00580 [Taibaiella sp. KBW10]|nr:hypothetical protein DBR32_00580 [Taibaiella sp. KBW10]
MIALLLLVHRLSAQGINEYQQFVKVNFPEFVQHFRNLDFKNFDAGCKTDLNFTDNNYSPEDWNVYTKKYKDFLIYNSDKSFVADLVSAYVDIERKNGVYYGTSDVDQAILLGDVKNKKLVQIGFCGPSCRDEEAKWINDYQFIIVGYYYKDDEQYVPTITLVNLNDKTKVTYMNETNTAKSAYNGKLFKKIRF